MITENKGEDMVTFQDIKNNDTIKTYIKQADASLNALGYTEHSFAHVISVANTAGYILETLNYPVHDIELVKIAAYLHDIGNLINRTDHAQSGAILAFRLLDEMGMPPIDIAQIATAIGNHDEGTGVPVNHIAAALILADKTDVRRSRVRNEDFTTFDIHDRVNYSVSKTFLSIAKEEKILNLKIVLDNHYGSVMDYFEIFMNRMLMCRKASESLGLKFNLYINDQQLI